LVLLNINEVKFDFFNFYLYAFLGLENLTKNFYPFQQLRLTCIF